MNIEEDYTPPSTTVCEWSVKKFAVHLCTSLKQIPLKLYSNLQWEQYEKLWQSP